MTPLQRWVAELWADVLDTPVPRLEDNFSALGGHSLHAVRAIYALRAGLGIYLPLAALFDTGTLGGLCEYLDRALLAAGRTLDPSFGQPAPRTGS